MEQFTKEQVAFEHPANGMNHCKDCRFFKKDDNRCQIVAGMITANDWCDQFEKEKPDRKGNPDGYTFEHQKITSRITGKKHEIMFGPQPGNLVPANPFASLAQEGYMHAHPEILGKEKLAEFDAATKGMHLPKKVKKVK